jgi:hypothetical protein
MKHTLLFAALLVGTFTANAQSRQGYVAGSTTLGERAGDASRAVTDTLAPGSWFYDQNTQLVRYGALCGTQPNEYNCGFILGSNEYGDKAKVQQFLLLDAPTTLIEGVIFWFYHKAGNESALASANIYAINGNGTNSTGAVTGQAPGTILGSKTFALSEVDTTLDNGFTTVMFDSPVWVSTQFAAGFDMTTLGTNDSLALLGTAEGITDFPDFSWEKWSDNRWFTIQTAWPGLNIDLCIFVLVDNSSVGINEPGSMNNMRMSFLNGNISNGTVQLAYDVVEAGRMDLIVHSNNGQIAYQQSFGTQGAGSYQHTMSTQGWASGTYYVTLKNNGNPLTKKLVVE